MKRATFTLLVLLGLTFVTVASANNYDESIDGDLSNDRNVPTSIPLSAGSNMVKTMPPISSRWLSRALVCLASSMIWDSPSIAKYSHWIGM